MDTRLFKRDKRGYLVFGPVEDARNALEAFGRSSGLLMWDRAKHYYDVALSVLVAPDAMKAAVHMRVCPEE